MDLPFDLQVEIMKRLPVKSLIRFRKVCKAWNSLISCSHFITGYSGQQHHLIVPYDSESSEQVDGEPDLEYVSIVDDHTFPQHKVSLTPPALVGKLSYDSIIGSSHGLVCLYNNGNMAVLWNPSIRKTVGVTVPNDLYMIDYDPDIYGCDLAFGVCRETNEVKIVKMNYINYRYRYSVFCVACKYWKVEVFILSTGAWRSPYSSILPRVSIGNYQSQVVIDGVLYWCVTDFTSEICKYYCRIVSFDITSEEFKEIILPDSLARKHQHHLSISNLRNALVVLQRYDYVKFCDVWVMEGGVSKSFTKLFTLCPPDVKALRVLGFRKSGEPVIGVDHDGSSLAFYEPDSNHVNNIEINVKGTFSVYAYTESLLLLDQPEDIIYGNTTPA